MIRQLLMMVLMLTLGFSPMVSVWAGNLSSATDEVMQMDASHDHSAMQQASADEGQSAVHCKLKCDGDCDSPCCSSGTCSSCGHCVMALINMPVVLPANIPVFSPIFVAYSLESRELAPPFRPPLLLHS